MFVLYLLSTGSSKNPGSVPSCEKVEKYYLLQIMQQQAEIEMLKQKKQTWGLNEQNLHLSAPQKFYITLY